MTLITGQAIPPRVTLFALMFWSNPPPVSRISVGVAGSTPSGLNPVIVVGTITESSPTARPRPGTIMVTACSPLNRQASVLQATWVSLLEETAQGSPPTVITGTPPSREEVRRTPATVTLTPEPSELTGLTNAETDVASGVRALSKEKSQAASLHLALPPLTRSCACGFFATRCM